MSDSSYGAYLLQAPILVYLTVALQGVKMPLLLKFAVVSPFGVAFCFGAACLIRKISKPTTSYSGKAFIYDTVCKKSNFRKLELLVILKR
jgi:hypothetical protein